MGNIFCKPRDHSCNSPKYLSVDINSLNYDCTNVSKTVKVCKVVVLGDETSSKSQLIRRYTDNTMSKQLQIENVFYHIAVWDVPNSIFDAYDMAHIYCQNATAAVIVIDVTHPNALTNAYQLISAVKLTNKDIPIVILANKWNSKSRLLNHNQMESFCDGIYDFISWQIVKYKYDGSIVSLHD
eukprot:UN01352